VRTLPIRLAPLPAEPLDSWLAALAFRSQVPKRDLLISVGMPTNARAREPSGYTTRLQPDEAEMIAAASGVAVSRLHAMTLALYDGQALDLHPQRGVVNRSRLWARGRGTRYCPACLADRGGRWLLRWRLTWSIACTEHKILLAHRCPDCGKPPEIHLRRGSHLAPSECSSRLKQGWADSCLCRNDLALVDDVIRLDEASPVLAAQRWLDGLLAGIEHRSRPGSVIRSIFQDLSGLCWWLLRRARPGDFASCGRAIDRARTGYGNEWRYPPIEAAVAAGPVTRAVEIYRGLGGPDSLAAVRTLLERDAAAVKTPSAIVHARRQHRSHLFQQVVWQAADATTVTIDRLRYRTPTKNPRAPIAKDPSVARRAASIPTLLWRDWAIALVPHLGYRDARAARAALSVALLLPGRDERAIQPLAALLYERQHVELSYFLHKISRKSGRDALTALCILADYLDEHPAPIDYQRRRSLDGAGLLPEEAWIEICCDTGTPTGTRGRLEAARRFLYQRITGVDLHKIEGPLQLSTGSRDAVRLAAAHFLMSEPLLTALDRHAHDYLTRQGIDEPVTWSPPISSVDDLDLPGTATLEFDLREHLADFYQQRLAPVAAARQLGISIERFKLEFETRPPATPWPHQIMILPSPTARNSGGSRLGGHLHRRRADELLTTEFLQQERGTHSKSAAAIARETGVPIKHVERRLQEENLNNRVHRRGPLHVDAAWLHEQYVVQERTINDIAAELGFPPSTLRPRMVEAGIILRQRPVSTGAPKYVPGPAPPLLMPALKRRIGLTRLRSFCLISGHATLPDAAAAQGISITTLYCRIKSLEADLGYRLFNRAQRGRPIKITPKGRAVITAMAELERADG